MRLVFACGVIGLLVSGCTRGWLVSDTVRPLTVNMLDTKTFGERASGRNYLLTEPITLPGIRVEWASLGIGDVGKKADFQAIHYADLHTFSILGSLFRIRKVRVYGEKRPHGADPQ